MGNYTYKNLLALLVFIVLVWGVNSFVAGMIDDNLNKITFLRKELILKESFNKQQSASRFSKSINEFVPDKLDKVAVTTYINGLLQDPSIKINSINIQEINTKDNKNLLDDNKENKKDSIDENTTIKSNTFKKAELNIKLVGNKLSLDKFLTRLVESKQYIDINSINFDFQPQTNSSEGNNISLSVLATIYYKNL
jgi:hypothetical protein